MIRPFTRRCHLWPTGWQFRGSFTIEHGIRAYGFHGTSHKYVSEKAAAYLQKKDSKIITIHLGNGCSMSAVKNGVCVDTSMGLGPMNGLIMGTRTGDIDQSVIFYMVNQLGYTLDEVNTILNKKSGMLGLTGFSDMRDVKAECKKGNQEAILAYEMYGYHIRKYIGSYTAVLNGLDAIVFTAGVGENDALSRKSGHSKYGVISEFIWMKKKMRVEEKVSMKSTHQIHRLRY